MLVMPDDAAPAPPPQNPVPRRARTIPVKSAPVADGGARVDGSTPLLFTGDPVRDCRLGSPAKRGSLQCLESDAVDVPSPPYLGKDDEVKALAIQKRLVAELDARQQDHDVADMERQAREYLKDEAKSEYEDKGKGYLLGESHGGRPVGVVESVKDAGLITEHYAQKTLDVFRGEGSSAACVLGSMSPNSCWDAYHENARKLESDTQDLDRQTAAFVAKSYGAKKGWDTTRRRLLGGDGAQIFLEAFH